MSNQATQAADALESIDFFDGGDGSVVVFFKCKDGSSWTANGDPVYDWEYDENDIPRAT